MLWLQTVHGRREGARSLQVRQWRGRLRQRRGMQHRAPVGAGMPDRHTHTHTHTHTAHRTGRNVTLCRRRALGGAITDPETPGDYASYYVWSMWRTKTSLCHVLVGHSLCTCNHCCSTSIHTRRCNDDNCLNESTFPISIFGSRASFDDTDDCCERGAWVRMRRAEQSSGLLPTQEGETERASLKKMLNTLRNDKNPFLPVYNAYCTLQLVHKATSWGESYF